MSRDDEGLDLASLEDRLQDVSKSFAPNELAYLALTSKVELPIRDRLAWSLHDRLGPRFVVAREWKRRDLAVLDSEAPDRPVLLLEAKAMYSFNGCNDSHLDRYMGYLRADVRKASALAVADTPIFILLLVTHVEGAFDPRLRRVVKYSSGISGATAAHPGPLGVQERCRATVDPLMKSFGPVGHGILPGGKAFGVQVDIDYWLVGPCVADGSAPTREALTTQDGGSTSAASPEAGEHPLPYG